MNRILLIGATGNIGRQVVTQLMPTQAQVRALVRNPEAAQLPRQIELMQGDLTRPDTLDACLAGIDTVFLVWTAPAAAVEGAWERIANHARRIVFLSAPLKTPHPFFQQPNPSRALAEEIERRIEASGLEWTFLRPGMFALDARHFWDHRSGPATSCAGHISPPLPPRSTSMISPRWQSARSVRMDMPEWNMS